MMTSIDALTGASGDCVEAVLMQQRPSWLPFIPAVLVWPLLFLGLAAGLPLIIAGAAAGGFSALPIVIFTHYWIIGNTSEGIVVARSKSSRAKATEITKLLPFPTAAAVDAGRIQRKVRLDGEEYFIAPQFVNRFNSTVGRTC